MHLAKSSCQAGDLLFSAASKTVFPGQVKRCSPVSSSKGFKHFLASVKSKIRFITPAKMRFPSECVSMDLV